jgi:tRNA(Ile)-lysidine synthase
MDLLQSFKDFTAKEHLFSSKDKLLLAVSGGVDSVVLCELCHQAGLDFIIAHCNFQLRGEESERDEVFVRQLAKKYDRELLVRRVDTQTYASANKLSIQVAARELRYNWFREITGRSGDPDSSAIPVSGHQAPQWILTAHHLDDNIETLLMNFFKGTGISGLRGILPRQDNIIRPLLFATKENLSDFAREFQLSWVEDSSNVSDKYTRNYFRHQVIPLVQQLYPGAVHNLADNIARFREIEMLYRQSVEQHKKKLLEYKGSEIHIPVLKLKKSAPLPTLVYEIIVDFGFSSQQVEGVINLLDSESGKYIQSATHRILKNRGWLIITAHPSVLSETILIESPEDRILYANGELRLELLDQPAMDHSVGTAQSSALRISSDPLLAQLDAGAIQFPLLLRKWRQGDYFYPLGLKKKKKLGRFFIDNKLSLAAKEKMWVIEMNKKIIWVVGLRIDDRVRITPQTRQVLKIESRLA